MKVEIITTGSVKWTVESIDNTLTPGDLVTVSSACKVSMSSEGFEELFFRYVNSSGSYVAAYEKAEEVHESVCGQRRYSDWNSFRNAQSYRLKKLREDDGTHS